MHLLAVSNEEHALRVRGDLKREGLVDGVLCSLDGQALVDLMDARVNEYTA